MKPQVNATIEIMHQVLGNLVQTYNLHETYVDETNPWMGILVVAAFTVNSTYHQTKVKIMVQMVFGQDMILPINHIVDRKYICPRKQTQIEKDATHKKSTIIDHCYRLGDRVMIRKHAAFKYERLFKGLFENYQTKTNGTVTLQTR